MSGARWPTGNPYPEVLCDDCGAAIIESHLKLHYRVCRAPLVCVCLTARPDGCGQCVHCLRRVIHLMSPDNYKAAIRTYPELVDQSVDWTYRLALVRP